jgi:microcin C transport system substrate-binding protein
MNDFDYDMTENSYPETDFPGTEQADYWGCAAANTPGSNNWSGICSPAIDAMIKAEDAAATPADKATAIHALDRLLLNGWYIVPWWSTNNERMAWWQDRVAKPDMPLQVGSDYDLWWHHPDAVRNHRDQFLRRAVRAGRADRHRHRQSEKRAYP